MDVTQQATATCRPATRLHTLEGFRGLARRGLALILANAMVWQPLLVQAEGIAINGGGGSLGAAANGVPVINIAKPNSNGLSHNTFEHYNVGSQGLILNNAIDRTQSTQLGGIILGNSHLQGQSATTILNEVTSNNRTQLKGYTEVAGQAARVIIANPYGITCDGCGFINTPQATLTTGKPVVDQGRLDRFTVDGGDIAIEGAGANASNLNQFDLITRSAKINAKLHAKKLNVIAGRNEVDASSLAVTALAPGGSPAPQLAIDSSALGGMYAGAIKLVGTEQGVGVKLSGEMAASAGDIQIDVDGNLTMATTAATAALSVKAQSLRADEALYAGGDLDINTRDELFSHKSMAAGGKVMLASNGQLTNLGAIEAGVNPDNSRNSRGDVQITAQHLRNAGQVIATRQLDIGTEQTLDNRDGKLIGAQVQLSATRLDNRNGLIGASTGETKVSAREQLDNRGGTLQAESKLRLDGGAMLNRNGVMLGKQVTLDAKSLDNSEQGHIVAEAGRLSATVEQALDNQQGRLQASAGDMELSAASLDNRGGVMVGEHVQVTATQGGLDNQGGQVLGSGLQVQAKTAIDNRDGGQLLAGSNGLKLGSAYLRNQQGQVIAGGSHAQLVLEHLDNRQGSISASSLSLTADEADNRAGHLASLDGHLQLSVARLNNQGGLIEASQHLLIEGQRLDNSAGGRLIAYLGELSRIQLGGELDNRSGRIAIGSRDFGLQAGTLHNVGGQIEHAGSGSFGLRSASLFGVQGRVIGQGSGAWNIAQVDGAGVWHLNGALDVSGLNSISLMAGDRIASAGNLSLAAVSLNNAGQLLSDGDLVLTLSGDLNNQGLISTQKALRIDAANLTQEGGRIASAAEAEVNLTGLLDNLGRLTAGTQLNVRAHGIDNRGTLGAQQFLGLTAIQGISNQSGGLIFSGADMQLRADSLLNRYADLYSKGNLSFAAVDGGRAREMRNLSGSIESEGDLQLKVGELENAKADFEAGESVANRNILINCIDCRGDRHSGYYIVRTTYEGSVLKDSPAARLLANRDLLLEAVTVTNGQSLLAANRNLSVTAANFYNRGLTLDNRVETVNYFLSDVSQSAYRVTEAATNAWNAWNAGLAPEDQAPIPVAITQYGVHSSNSTLTPGTNTLESGTVQAGATLSLNISGELVNGPLSPQGDAQLRGTTLDSQAYGAGGQEVILGTQAGAPGPLKDVKRVEVVNADGSVHVSFVPQDFSDAPFVSVDPTSLPTFRLPQGEYGLFTQSRNPASQYLIETNPALTDLKRFMSSDYLLGQLNYDFREASRRLGDGQYETRLIADAVRAQTGQRFLANGLSSDYEQFQYLMDNAIGSKSALGLSVGVGLTAEQVAALTHDIVWMEERLVDGESVLAPVLYLAKVDSRNLRGASLIQGRDVNLISGADLKNVGTLRASKDLTLISGGSVLQGGLVQANDRLSLLAQGSIRNALAGEIRADKVDLTSLSGHIVNDRTATALTVGAGSVTHVDAGSLISAGSQLTLNAAQDLVNAGRISSGGDATLSAGNDINLLAAEDRTLSVEALGRGIRREEHMTQLGSSVRAEGNLTLKAGNDINALASSASAGEDLSVEAARDINLASAADEHTLESRYKKGQKKVHSIDSQTRQVASEFSAGGNLDLLAGRDATLVASTLEAGEEAYVHAGQQLNLLAAENSDYSLYDMKKKGSWGSKKTQRDEVTDITKVGSTIKAGGDLTLKSGGDQTYQVAKLDSGRDILLDSGGAIAFEGVKDLHQESHEKTNNNAFWVSSKGKGNTDETLRQSQMVAAGNIVIKAVDGLQIDVRQVNRQSVSQTIDAMVAADPQLAWLKDAERRGDVDWRQVKEIHDSFKYSNAGLGPASQIIIAILMGAVIGPMAGGLVGGGTTGAVVGAVASGASTNATVSFINNGGNLGAVFKDVTSSNAMKGYLIAGATAGLTSGVFDGLTGTQTNPYTGKVTVPNLSTWTGVGQFAANQTLQSGTSMLLSKALGQGGSASDALKSALFNTLAAASFNAVGDYTEGVLTEGMPPKILVHAMVGGLLSKATGGDFKTGALAAGVNEALVVHLDKLVSGNKTLLSMSSQIVGVLTAAAQKDADAQSMEKGGWVAKNATQYNYLGHQELDDLEKEARNCKALGNCDEVRERFRKLSVQLDDELAADCGRNPSTCPTLYGDLLHDRNSLQERLAKMYFDDSIPSMFKADLHRYQLQNTSAIGTLTQAQGQFSLENKGVSPEKAEWGSALLAAMGGFLGAKGEVHGLLSKPGSTSVPASGVGSSAVFKVDSNQVGTKFRKHVKDYGGNPANPADRKMVLDRINDIGNNPEKVIPGTFAGQGANGLRGDVFFRIKGNDVVVTKPNGMFVTILKDGVTENLSVKTALKGGVR